MANPTFSFTSPSRQYFSLPYFLISYVTERPSSSALGYQKLQQTCKHFFAKNKLIIVDTSVLDWRDKLHYFDDNFLLQNIQYWLTDGLYIRVTNPITVVRDGIYRCDLKNLLLRNIIISYNDIDFFISSEKKLKDVGWYNVTITNNNSKNPFTIVDLLSKLPHITEFHYQNEKKIWTNETFKKLNSINFIEKFDEFIVHIFKLAYDVDFSSRFCNFIKKNAAPDGAEFCFFDDKYGYSMLEAAVKRMFQEWPEENRIPIVSFSTFW